MPKKRSFLLTIFPAEETNGSLHGRLQVISTGVTHTFASLEELQRLIDSDLQAPGQPVSIAEAATRYLPGRAYPDISEEAVNNPASITDDTSFSM